MRTSHNLRSHHGFSLIETAIVLAVVGLVIGGIWVAAASVTQQKKIDDTLTAISAIHTNLSRLYGGNRPSANTSISGALLRQITPANLQIDPNYDTNILDPLGGSILVSASPHHITLLLQKPDFEEYCKILAPRLGSTFKRLIPTEYDPLTPHLTTSNVMGGANDSDISTPEGAAQYCGIEDGIILFLTY